MSEGLDLLAILRSQAELTRVLLAENRKPRRSHRELAAIMESVERSRAGEP